jgi:hypothetical protein
MEQIPCTVCKEGGHKSAKCPTLYDPLKEGFYSGGGGGGGHSHDDDDEHLVMLRAVKQMNKQLRFMPDRSKTLVPL